MATTNKRSAQGVLDNFLVVSKKSKGEFLILHKSFLQHNKLALADISIKYICMSKESVNRDDLSNQQIIKIALLENFCSPPISPLCLLLFALTTRPLCLRRCIQNKFSEAVKSYSTILMKSQCL